MSQGEILSLGAKLDKKTGAIWREVAREAFANSPYPVPAVYPDDWRKRRGKDKEFFILHHEAKPIARAAITLDNRFAKTQEQWNKLGMEVKAGLEKEKLGSIDDLAIIPEHKDKAQIIIEHCLGRLREKGAGAVVVRGHNFWGLLAEGEGQPPPALTYTPPWYIDVFQEMGFAVAKEWTSFELAIPPIEGNIPTPPGLLEMRPMRWRDRRQMKRFVDKNVPPQLRQKNPFSWFIFYPGFLIQKLIRFRTYVIKFDPNRIDGYLRFMPSPEAMLMGEKPPRRFDLIELIRRFRAWRRGKTVVIAGVRFDEEQTQKGLFYALIPAELKIFSNEGFEKLYVVEPGENPVMGPVWRKFQTQFGGLASGLTILKYYTLTYTF